MARRLILKKLNSDTTAGELLHNLYSSTYFIQLIIGNTFRTHKMMRNTYKSIIRTRLLQEPRRKYECRPNIRCNILKKEGVRVMIGLSRFRIGYSGVYS
jgi:hypothetical protein